MAILISFAAFSQSTTYPTKEIESYFDIKFTTAERDSLFKNLQDYQRMLAGLHAYPLDNSVGMSLRFDPAPIGYVPESKQLPIDWGLPKGAEIPKNLSELAFFPVHKLSVLIRNQKITSTQLTQLCIDRLKKYSDTLQCTITLMETSALAAARKADEEISRGKYRGPLHGIPYGIKDLLSVEGTKTTWGAAPFKDQQIQQTATVVKKLEDAGAVLVVKLTMGALALGDIWYGGITKNPWDLKQGSSGSSAGSASATAAGLVPFAIGTETLGSIVSPSTRCGTTGLRPSFGRVSRHGAMALCWSMDKIGPLCRSALDCAIVFDAIRGTDGLDPNVRDMPFNFSRKADIKKLRVGYFKNLFDETYPTKDNDIKTLEVIRGMGINLEAVTLSTKLPVASLRIILSAEAAAAFDDLTRTNKDSLLTDQRRNAWPNTFRAARFIPAVDYVNATRVRSQLVDEFHQLVKDYDVILTPSFGGIQLLMTNLTGTPCVVVPNGFNAKGSPTSISFIGKWNSEASLVLLAQSYQEATIWDEQVPPFFK